MIEVIFMKKSCQAYSSELDRLNATSLTKLSIHEFSGKLTKSITLLCSWYCSMMLLQLF
jgi:hypothetical protein